MDMKSDQLHILFLPLMARGHILPILDIAKLCAKRGVKITIITTPSNAPLFTKSIQSNENPSTSNINLKTIPFPAKEAGLPEGVDYLDEVPDEDMFPKFCNALPLLQAPLEVILQELHPQGLVSDMFFPWTTELASKYGIPRFIFHCSSNFTMCAENNIAVYQPHKNVSSDTEPFVLPAIPDRVTFTRMQLADERFGFQSKSTDIFERIREAEKISYGTLVNSFYELEPAYVDYYRNVLGRRTWNLGPVSLCNRKLEDKAQRGKTAPIGEQECLKWLDAKKTSSVIYVSFGSITRFSDSQLHEIAVGLESSGQDFIWVVNKERNNQESQEEWLPEGYDARIQGKGLILRGWAPQILILDHEAVGGFLTHCGWNSVLEGVSAGLPMVTWPVCADQFYNEKLVTDILRIGISVGAQKWVWLVGDYVKSEAIEKAVREIMVGDRAEEMRNKARVLSRMAKGAVEEGGSSYNDLSALVEELKSFHT